MSVATPTCPHCEGRQRVLVHLHTTTGGRWEERDCPTCGGTGLVSREHAERIAEGDRRREDRKARLMTLRQEAEYLGITPRELSDIENGRLPGTPGPG